MFRLFIALLFAVVLDSASADELGKHYIYGNIGGEKLRYNISVGPGADFSMLVIEHVSGAREAGIMFAAIPVQRSAIEQNRKIAGKTQVRLLLPGCRLPSLAQATYQFSDGVLLVAGRVPSKEIWNATCAAAVNHRDYSFVAEFPKITPDDRMSFGLLSSPSDGQACALVVGRQNSLSTLIGEVMTVFPNGWAHDADRMLVARGMFRDMTINSLKQVGPDAWDVKQSFVFDLGDQVRIINVVRAPRVPGGYEPVRAFLVEVERIDDGKKEVVDLDQLVRGDPLACSPVLLLGYGRKVEGVFVKVKPGATLVAEGTKLWVNDPSIKYGYCQDYRDGRLTCQTREYPRADLPVAHWMAKAEDVEILKSKPSVW